MFGIGFGISIPLVFLALAFDDIGIWFHQFRAWIKRVLLGTEKESFQSKDGRQMSDLQHKMQSILDVPRPSNVEKVKSADEKEGKSLAFEVDEMVNGIRPRTRRESRASRGSWARPRISFDRRARLSEDLERGTERK